MSDNYYQKYMKYKLKYLQARKKKEDYQDYFDFFPKFVKACKEGELKIVKDMANEEPEHETSMRTGLYEAVRHDQLEVVRFLAPILSSIITNLKKNGLNARPMFNKANREVFFGADKLSNGTRKQILVLLLSYPILFTEDEYGHLDKVYKTKA